jgi:hypothetical protein
MSSPARTAEPVTPTWWVLVMAADGPVLVPHTDGELRDLWAGVDPEAARLMTETPDRKEP